jgi:hypothetical protein
MKLWEATSQGRDDVRATPPVATERQRTGGRTPPPRIGATAWPASGRAPLPASALSEQVFFLLSNFFFKSFFLDLFYELLAQIFVTKLFARNLFVNFILSKFCLIFFAEFCCQSFARFSVSEHFYQNFASNVIKIICFQNFSHTSVWLQKLLLVFL